MGARAEGLRVIVIDDDETDRGVVCQLLKEARAAVDVVECVGVHEAFELVDRDFDCILLDAGLPGLTATELLARVRERWPAVPTVVLTGAGDEQLAVDVMKAGAVDYLAKDRLDRRTLSRLLAHVFALRAGRVRLDEADRARAVYATKLRQLIDATPPLYRGETIEERLRAAADTAAHILEANEAFVAVRSEERWFREVARPGDVAAAGGLLEVDRRWTRFVDWAERLDLEAPKLDSRWTADSDEEVFHQRLWDEQGESVGVIAVRAAGAVGATSEVCHSLLAQLGHMVVSSVENLRLYQAARDALASRDTVMAVVSHDLRSPLSTIALSLGLLRNPAPSSTPVKVIDRMDRAATHMKRLLDDLMDVARIDSHNFAVTVAREPVASLLSDAVALCETLATDAGRVLVVEPPAPGVEVLVDRHRLVQVLSNLIDNAIGFAPSDSRVLVRAEASDTEVTFSVRDAGPGIDPEHLPHIFDRFWRKDRRGLGLGLFIAKAIVDAHGGRIWAQSKLAEGATFFFAVPRAAAATA